MLAIVALLACRNPFADPDDVAIWANTASAVAVYSNAYQPIAFADGQTTFEDPNCPTTSDDGTTVAVTGGCTDSGGNAWIGSATITRDGDDRAVAFDGYGSSSDPASDAGLSGTFDLSSTGSQAWDFDADLVNDGGTTVTISYHGAVTGDYDAPTTWNGSGTVEREGPLSPTGTVDASTADERLDDAICAGQAISGTTTVEAGRHELVITYDGGEDCDPDQAAKYAVDGEDQGLVDAISCSNAPTTRPWLVLPLLAVRRRRRR